MCFVTVRLAPKMNDLRGFVVVAQDGVLRTPVENWRNSREANMAVSTKSRQVILIRSPFGDVSMPRRYIPLLRAGSIVLFVLSVIAAWQLIVMIGQYPSFILPTPGEVWAELVSILPTAAF